MHPSQPSEHDVRTPRTAELCFSWSAANHRGLDLAHHGDWSLAADAFAEAVDLLAGAEPQEPGTHDALALVLSNLAVACFRADRLDDGIRHAQRACALRVALVGEDAVAVARARSDLAVMLCAAGRTDEAAALIHRAIVGVEHHAGDEDLRLVPLLENAARVAMAIGQPAAAEPHLLRLHALLAAHDLPVESAEFLLRKVAMSRNQRRPATPAEQAVAENAVAGQAIAAHSAAGPSPAPAAASLDAPADTPPDLRADVAIEHADALELVGDTRTIELQAIPRETLRETPREIPRETPSFDADDQPLRDAVALTGVLLRTTPTGAPVVRHRDANADVWRASEVPDDNPLPHHLPERGLAHVREGDVREAVAHIASQAHAESVQSHDALETMRSRTLAPIADPMPIRCRSISRSRPPSRTNSNAICTRRSPPPPHSAFASSTDLMAMRSNIARRAMRNPSNRSRRRVRPRYCTVTTTTAPNLSRSGQTMRRRCATVW